jgi:protein-S-isoprenylcysteine O-methyltransferase Ste14
MRRRQKVEAKHVIAPFAAILVGAVTVLFVYTFVDPPVWVREPLGDGDTDVTYGRCQESLWFEVVLDLLLTVAVAISVWQAWKTRALPEDISDGKRVWQTLTAHLVILISKSAAERD